MNWKLRKISLVSFINWVKIYRFKRINWAIYVAIMAPLITLVFYFNPKDLLSFLIMLIPVILANVQLMLLPDLIDKYLETKKIYYKIDYRVVSWTSDKINAFDIITAITLRDVYNQGAEASLKFIPYTIEG